MIKLNIPLEYVVGYCRCAHFEIETDEKDWKRFKKLYKLEDEELSDKEACFVDDYRDSLFDMGHVVVDDYEINDFGSLLIDEATVEG